MIELVTIPRSSSSVRPEALFIRREMNRESLAQGYRHAVCLYLTHADASLSRDRRSTPVSAQPVAQPRKAS